jgi:hypothetical protein
MDEKLNGMNEMYGVQSVTLQWEKPKKSEFLGDISSFLV